MKIHTGDKVRVIKGRDKGKTGTVLAVSAAKNQVKVEGVNIHKRHLKKSSRPGVAGGITDVTLALSISNVMLIDPATNQVTRVGYKMVGDKKVRLAKKTKTIIEDVKK